MKLLVLLLCLVVPRNDTPLLEAGQATNLRPQPAAPNEIKVISYNIRWRGGDDLKTLIKLLQEDPEIGGPRRRQRIQATRRKRASRS